jgi:ubiquinone/menaquinone biosynthesis C-methylase UbiE
MKKISLVSATNKTAQKKLGDLNVKLMKFYNEDIRVKTYFKHAHTLNEVWQPGSYHWVLRSLTEKGMLVLDLGCGSGHAFENLESCVSSYTGIDWSEKQIQENSKKYQGKAAFIASPLYRAPFRANSFDLVFSLYVLEHLIWPHRFLKEMVRLTRQGGFIVIICPHFRKAGRMPSFPHGGPRSFREKLQKVQLIGALKHLWYRWHWPRIIQQEYPQEKGDLPPK